MRHAVLPLNIVHVNVARLVRTHVCVHALARTANIVADWTIQ